MALAETLGQVHPPLAEIQPLQVRTDRIAQDASFMFSQGFWLVNADLLSHASSVITQFGVSGQGELQGVSQSSREVVTLAFDSSERECDLYTWQLTVAARGRGRTVSQLSARRFGASAVQRRYDMQGKSGPTEETDAGELADLIQATVAEGFVQEHAEHLREQRDRAQVELERLSVEGLRRYAPEKYDRELGNRRQNLARSGFGQWTMQEL